MRFSIHNPDVVACIKRAYTHRDNYELRSRFQMELRPHGPRFPYIFADAEDVISLEGTIVGIVADKGFGVCVYALDGKFVG